MWFSIFFGDRLQMVEPDGHRGCIWPLDGFPLQKLIFQHQVHGITGNIISINTLERFERSLSYDGDYLVTNLSQVGIGVLTADCLPIAIADQRNKAVAIIHAGWRGTVGGIVREVLKDLQKTFGTNPRDLEIYYGPCAHACCYQVDPPFLAQLPAWARSAVIVRDGKSYFDLCACNTFVLESCGVQREQIDLTASKCTICNKNFCSYRRNPGITARQMSIIWLH